MESEHLALCWNDFSRFQIKATLRSDGQRSLHFIQNWLGIYEHSRTSQENDFRLVVQPSIMSWEIHIPNLVITSAVSMCLSPDSFRYMHKRLHGEKLSCACSSWTPLLEKANSIVCSELQDRTRASYFHTKGRMKDKLWGAVKEHYFPSEAIWFGSLRTASHSTVTFER